MLSEVRPTDVFISSFPKSGNTWLRFIIANALTESMISFKNINEFVPGLYNFSDQINAAGNPRFIKCHEPTFAQFPRSIGIVRDLRDLVISYYHYQSGHDTVNESLRDFVMKRHFETQFGSWSGHCLALAKEASVRPGDVLILRFEDLLEAPHDNICKILEFCSIDEKKSVAEIVSLTRFEILKQNELKHGRVFEISPISFFRNGTSGQWKTELSEDVRLRLERDNQIALRQFGYL